jgi:hypothetical protein
LKRILFSALLLIPVLSAAQTGIDLTGRASLRVQQTEYDQNSEIRPDSVAADQYSKTTVIPGLQQYLNLSLFGRTRDLDLTLLADIRNNDWDRFDLKDLNSISRFTLDVKFANNHVVIGDFFESGNELLLQSREVRGAKYSLLMENAFGKNNYLETSLSGGIVQRAAPVGSRQLGLFHQYETSGQFRRYMGTAKVKNGKSGVYDITLNYLWGRDQQSSIDESINPALHNQVFGGRGNLFFWDRNIRLFGEYYASQRDTLNSGSDPDDTYRGGLDFRYDNLKVIALYQRLGYNYFTMGYPFLEQDKQGLRGEAAYNFPGKVLLSADVEQYENNLKGLADLPTNTTRIANFSVMTFFKNWPEFTLKYGMRSDDSKTVYDAEANPLKTKKYTRKYEARIGYRWEKSSISLSAIKLKLDDKSLVTAGTPLGTDQTIGSLNLYTRAIKDLFFSGGGVYSLLDLTNGQTNTNMYLYESIRWDILPRKLQLESTMSYILNDASNGGVQDLLSDYSTIAGQLSLEYFINLNVSVKIIAGTDWRSYAYSVNEALQVIADPDYGPTYFNANESYQAIIVGGELNWTF